MIENFLITILKVTLITSLVDVFSSVFKLKNYITLVSNFIILSILISPFTGLNINDIEFEENLEKFFYVETEKENEKIYKNRQKEINEEDYTKQVLDKEIIEKNYEELIKEHLETIEIDIEKVDVEIEDDFSKIKYIKVEVIDNEMNEEKYKEKNEEKTITKKELVTQISNTLELDEKLIQLELIKKGKNLNE